MADFQPVGTPCVDDHAIGHARTRDENRNIQLLGIEGVTVLKLAASLGIATAVKASLREPDVTIPRMPEREREYVKRVYFDQTRDGQRAKHVEAMTTQNIVLPILALVGGCLALAIPDPVLTLPLVWGVVLQRGFPRSAWLWLAIGILLGGSAISVLRIFLWEF